MPTGTSAAPSSRLYKPRLDPSFHHTAPLPLRTHCLEAQASPWPELLEELEQSPLGKFGGGKVYLAPVPLSAPFLLLEHCTHLRLVALPLFGSRRQQKNRRGRAHRRHPSITAVDPEHPRSCHLWESTAERLRR